MKVYVAHYNKETGEFKIVEEEEEGDGFVFCTHTNFPIERLKKNKVQEDQTPKPEEEEKE